MKSINKLSVEFLGKKVGTMALYNKRFAAFEYDSEWLAEGFAVSPFSLPLEKKVYIPKSDVFDGAFGVFADSLPDGWGRLLLDRLLKKNGMNPYELTVLDRLAIVGNSGMGALTYVPQHTIETGMHHDMGYDEIAMACMEVLNTEATEDLDVLFEMGGSSGGARPKILTDIDGEPWIVKFPSALDPKGIGEQEYRYAQCALRCGIEMAETRLFESDRCSGYFGTRRFDRGAERIHMVSVSGLLETSHRIPNLDYNILMKLTLELTRSFSEIEKLFRLMCFNVFAHNRDDHSKNFSFLYNLEERQWKLAPAYDLTYSHSIGGEHATSINGNGRDPGPKEIIHVAEMIGLKRSKAKEIMEMIQETVSSELGSYLK